MPWAVNKLLCLSGKPAQRTRGCYQVLKSGRYFLPRASLQATIGVDPQAFDGYEAQGLFEKREYLV
jgi:hypothetical protein